MKKTERRVWVILWRCLKETAWLISAEGPFNTKKEADSCATRLNAHFRRLAHIVRPVAVPR